MNAMQPTLYTERLILRPLTLDDAEATQQQFPHWEVVRYLNAVVPWPYPADGARSYLEHVALPAMARGKEWHWSIRLKSAPEPTLDLYRLGDLSSSHSSRVISQISRGKVPSTNWPSSVLIRRIPSRSEMRREPRLGAALGTRNTGRSSTPNQ